MKDDFDYIFKLVARERIKAEHELLNLYNKRSALPLPSDDSIEMGNLNTEIEYLSDEIEAWDKTIRALYEVDNAKKR